MKNCTDDRRKIIEIFEQFGEFLQNDLNGIEYTLNIGEKCESISKLQKSFHETSKTNSVLEHINRKNEIIFYDEMGFYRMLMSYEILRQCSDLRMKCLILSYSMRRKLIHS